MQQLALADTRMTIKDPDNEKITSWSNDKYFRTTIPKDEESPMSEGDMLADLRSKKTYMINDKEKVIVNISQSEMPFANLRNNTDVEKVKIDFKNKGSDKKIAGLSTIKYHIYVQGEKCFEILMTKNKNYGDVMRKLDSLQEAENNSNADNICEQAENQMDLDKLAKHGYPVKKTDSKGIVQFELLEFKTGIKAPKNYLAFPKGYKVKSMMEMIKEAMSKQMLKQFGQSNPE